MKDPLTNAQLEQILRAELGKSPGMAQWLFSYKKDNKDNFDYNLLCDAFANFRREKRQSENLLLEQKRPIGPDAAKTKPPKTLTDPALNASKGGGGKGKGAGTGAREIICHNCGGSNHYAN